jgi:putative oxidoreductase
MEDLAVLVLRCVAGAIFVAQGYRKLFGAPDAHHGRSNLVSMISGRGLPRAGQLAVLTSVVELVFGSLVLVGWLTWLAVIPLMLLLLGAIVLFKVREGFIGGWDWPLSVMAALVAILLLGAGEYSVDHLLQPGP